MSTTYSLLVSTALLLWAYMTAWFLLSVIKRRNDIADVAWGLGFIIAGFYALSFNQSPTLSNKTVVVLTTIWGVRLAVHILTRNRGKTEDYRYAAWRNEWKSLFYVRSYLQVFLLQGLLLLAVAMPVVLTAGLVNTFDVSAWVSAGIILWASGFITESFADLQLRKFLNSKPTKGSVLQTGLWKYSRHPNYFGEVIQWWGIWLIMASTTLSMELKLLGLLGPLTITTLIIFVSGIPMLEKKSMQNPEYKKYARVTNKFFPWNPKSN